MPTINPDGHLAGQVAVVTGASRGIGEAIAKRYAMEGAKVVVSARSVAPEDHFLPGSINETVRAIRAAGGEATPVRADLSRAEDRHNLITATEAAYGPVDILVNNAAVTWFMPVTRFAEKRFRIMMDVQVWGPFELAQLCLPSMLERGAGWIHVARGGAGQRRRQPGAIYRFASSGARICYRRDAQRVCSGRSADSGAVACQPSHYGTCARGRMDRGSWRCAGHERSAARRLEASLV